MIEIAGGIILAGLFFIGVILMFSEEGRELLAMIFGGIVALWLIGFYIVNKL